jgi:hypothetical protein
VALFFSEMPLMGPGRGRRGDGASSCGNYRNCYVTEASVGVVYDFDAAKLCLT